MSDNGAMDFGYLEEEVVIDMRKHRFITTVTSKCQRRACIVSEYDPHLGKILEKKVRFRNCVLVLLQRKPWKMRQIRVASLFRINSNRSCYSGLQ